MPGDFDVAFGVDNFDVAFARVNRDVPRGIVDVDVSPGGVDDQGSVHIGHRHVAALVANGDSRAFWHGNVQIHTGARIAARTRGANFEGVAVFGDFEGDGGSNVLGVGFVPGFDVFLAVHMNLRIVPGAHADIAATVTDGDAGVFRNGLRFHVQVEIEAIAADRKVLQGKLVLEDVDAGNTAKKKKQSENQENLAGGYGRSARLARTAGHRALIELDGAPKDDEQRPPMAKEASDV